MAVVSSFRPRPATWALATTVLLLLPLGQALVPAPTAPTETPDVWVAPEARAALDTGGTTQLLLGFAANPSAADLAPLRSAGIPTWRAEHLPAAAAAITPDQLDLVLDTPGLLSVAHNEPIVWHQLPDADPGNLGGTGDVLTRSDQARALGVDGSGVTIAVVDTGVDGTHPAVRPELLGGPMRNNVWFFVGEGGGLGGGTPTAPASVFLEHQLDTDPADGHGTHVASTALGDPTADGRLGGRAPGADLVACSIGDAIFVYWGLACFDWILGHHEEYDIRIVTNSWGAPGPWMPLHPINLATKALDEAGLLVLFAAGNSGPDAGTLTKYARAPWVIGVGSTSLAGAVSTFSSRGSAEFATGPDLMAPGHNIVAARSKPVSLLDSSLATPYYDAAYIDSDDLPRYRTSSGTSMATPQVAGIAALVLEANPTLSPAQVRDILYQTARPIAGATYGEAGHGLVDAEAAVRMALGLATEAPDYADATERTIADDHVRYDFHGALVGGPVDGWQWFRQEMPILVRTPADGMELHLSWTPPVTPNPLARASSIEFTLVAPDGYEAYADGIGTRTGTPGNLIIQVDNDTLNAHNPEGWTAGYWTATAAAFTGAVELDLSATIHYADGVPAIDSDLTPPPPPPPIEYVAHDPIKIATDDDFTPENGVTGGAGTPGDPYIIEGWDITSPGAAPSIHIGGPLGTTAHLQIRNLYAHASTDTCVKLENAHNVEFVGIEVDSCEWGIYIGGGSSDIVVRDSRVHHVERAIGLYGAERVTLRDNHVHDTIYYGITASQGAAAGGTRFPLVTDILVEGNRFESASITAITPAATGWTVRDNEMTRSSMVFSAGSAGHTISDMNWTSGIPSYRHRVLNFPSPPHPGSTIVDAGRTPLVGADGSACFDPELSVMAPRVVEEVAWQFGDGAEQIGTEDPCHTYADPEATYVATLVVTTRSVDGVAEVFTDDVWVNP